MSSNERLLAKFRFGNRDSLTRDELVAIADYLLNRLGRMSSDCLKVLEIIKDVPCTEYRVSDIPGKPHSKTLWLYYEVSNDFIKNKLTQYGANISGK